MKAISWLAVLLGLVCLAGLFFPPPGCAAPFMSPSAPHTSPLDPSSPHTSPLSPPPTPPPPSAISPAIPAATPVPFLPYSSGLYKEEMSGTLVGTLDINKE